MPLVRVRYLLTRLAIAFLVTLVILFVLNLLVIKSRSEVTTFQADVSTSDAKIAEKWYWDDHYDYHKVIKHTKEYRFDKLISETRRYMDGREEVQGIGATELLLINLSAAGLIFMIVFAVIPRFAKPSTAELQ